MPMIEADRYRLSAADLAVIDIKLERVAEPERARFREAMQGLNQTPGTLSIATAVQWLAIFNNSTAAAAHEELFEALNSGALDLEFVETSGTFFQ